MNKIIILFFIVSAVTAQKWGGGYEGGRRPVVPAPIGQDGRVVDTPEIAHLKAAHFAAHDAALRSNPPRAQPYTDYNQNSQNNYNGQNSYNGQQNNYNGQNNYNNQNAKYTQDYDYDRNDDRSEDYDNNQVEKRWRGPYAKIEFTNDGKFLKDTPEVAHARQQHLAALSAAKQNGGYGYEGDSNDERYNGQYRGDDERGGQGDDSWQRNQYNGGRPEDDGQYRGEGSGQYNRRTNWQGQPNQYNDRQGPRY